MMNILYAYIKAIVGEHMAKDIYHSDDNECFVYSNSK